MEIIGSLVLFIVFIFIYLMIVEIFVMLFRITGLPDEKARFQVVSMLTNSGYTTREAELVVNSRIRRKLSRFVMMFGYAFTVTIVSTVVNIFLQFRQSMTWGAVASIPMIVIVVVIAWFVRRSKWLNHLVDKIIQKIANKFIYKTQTNPIIIIDKYGELSIARIDIKFMPEKLNNITLIDSKVRAEYGINFLVRKNSDGEVIPKADTVFQVGDTLVVMGKESSIRDLFGVRLRIK